MAPRHPACAAVMAESSIYSAQLPRLQGDAAAQRAEQPSMLPGSLGGQLAHDLEAEGSVWHGVVVRANLCALQGRPGACKALPCRLRGQQLPAGCLQAWSSPQRKAARAAAAGRHSQ